MSKATKHSHKIVRWIISAVFIFWIMPLGVFIKPAQEEKACNGRRAICLCSKLLGKVLAKKLSSVSLQQNGAPVKKEGAASHHDFLRPELARSRVETPAFYARESQLSYAFHFVRTIEAVPKNSFSVG